MAATDLWWDIHRNHSVLDILAIVQDDENHAHPQKNKGVQTQKEGDRVPRSQFRLIARCCQVKRCK